MSGTSLTLNGQVFVLANSLPARTVVNLVADPVLAAPTSSSAPDRPASRPAAGLPRQMATAWWKILPKATSYLFSRAAIASKAG